MKVIRASVLGYCMGVRRAVDAAEKSLQENESFHREIYTLGPLIHNPTVLKNLEDRGLKVLTKENLSDAGDSSIVIIRAHGTTPVIMRRLEQASVHVVDATCPRVHLSQKRAAEWSSKGYAVIIAGDRNHGEVTSIIGFAEENSVKTFVVQNADDANKISVPEKAILIAQTTFSPNEFCKIAEILQSKNNKIEVFNSICSATLERQNALKQLAGQVDGILVIGGKNSANTRRLFETAASLCHAALIENENQIPSEFYEMGIVGITAGASTPDEVIDKTEKELFSRKK
ncbi:MAG: 4-hydroxy-3-methylbut-2-enyl diphosphate reductase [Treponema sp.]|nr:4-hydroxy-3-methylbut-2-enyl diphosphate reductase [Treponema sp.]